MTFVHRASRQKSFSDTGSTESREDYLVCIFELISNKGYARGIEIANRLAVAQASVSIMIKRLAEAGYVKHEKYRGFTLTESGQVLARGVHFRRSILITFLESLGVPHDVVREDVHGLEHHLSRETLNCLRRFLEADRKTARRFNRIDEPLETFDDEGAVAWLQIPTGGNGLSALRFSLTTRATARPSEPNASSQLH
jgi:DtxR family transcriptional regulator, manganese transport regulator